MTYYPQGFSEQTKNSRQPESNFESIDNLVDFLLDSEVVNDDSLNSEISLNNYLDYRSETSGTPEIEQFWQPPEAKKFDRNPCSKNHQNLDEIICDSQAKESTIEPESFTEVSGDNERLDHDSWCHLSDYRAKKEHTASNVDMTSVAESDNSLTAAPTSLEDLDLVDSVNTLIPLIVELLQCQVDNSQEAIIQAVTPVIDQLIEQRSLEDAPKMAGALAKILPSAITTEINLAPEAIAKAIAPEIALSIKEQIRLDENAISEALGSEMGKAIKTQIELERDAMVDALYPVIGTTISKYMVEVVQEINRKVEKTFSLEGINRKIRARIKGVSEAELILQESVGYDVKAVFLIDKDSGVIIEEVQKPDEQHLDSDMIAGMLTAIRSFANDCIASGSELDTIDYGDCQIPLEVAGYCYLAVVLKGEPDREFRTRIRQTLGEIVLNYGGEIESYQGDIATVPPAIKPLLGQLTEKPHNQRKSSSPSALLGLLVFILGIIFVPLGITRHRLMTNQNIEQTTARKLDAAPELSVYRLESQVSRGVLTVRGRVPSKYLQTQAASIIKPIAKRYNLQLNNQIITVDVPVNPSLITGETKRLTSFFNQQPETIIETHYQPKTLTIEGYILNKSIEKNIIEGFSSIPGVEKIILNVDDRLPTIKQRIYFDLRSNQFDFASNSSKIDAVRLFLDQHPQLNLKLIVHSDGRGSTEFNQKLAQERCHNVEAALVARGVQSTRLITSCNEPITPANKNSQVPWLHRYVGFEPLIPARS